MKIIELYGYSGSGKSFYAQTLKNENYKNFYLNKMFKYNKFKRVIDKLKYLLICRNDDFIFIFSIHKKFRIKSNVSRLKNIYNFLYIIGLIKHSIKYNRSMILDHGIFQSIFSCYIQDSNPEKIIIDSELIDIYLKKLLKNASYELIFMNTDFNIIKKRHKENKNNLNLIFLKKNNHKILLVYEKILSLINKLKYKNLKFIEINKQTKYQKDR